MTYDIQSFEASTPGRFRWLKLSAPNPKGTLLVLQGYGEYIEKYLEVMEAWRAAGFDVIMPEWRSQGRSDRFMWPRILSYVPDFAVLIDDLEKFYQQQMKDAALPITLVGHSMGGHLALRWYTEKHQDDPRITGVALLSPMHDINLHGGSLDAARKLGETLHRWHMGWVPTTLIHGHWMPNNLTYDEKRFRDNRDYMRKNHDVVPGWVTVGWAHAAMQSTYTMEQALIARRPAGRYMVLAPEDDFVVATGGTKRLLKSIPQATAHYYPHARHELLQEVDAVRGDVIKRVTAFALGQ